MKAIWVNIFNYPLAPVYCIVHLLSWHLKAGKNRTSASHLDLIWLKSKSFILKARTCAQECIEKQIDNCKKETTILTTGVMRHHYGHSLSTVISGSPIRNRKTFSQTNTRSLFFTSTTTTILCICINVNKYLH